MTPKKGEKQKTRKEMVKTIHPSRGSRKGMIKRKDIRPSHRPMDPRKARFAQEYVIDFNGARASVRAGYEGELASHHVRSSELLNDPEVFALIQKLAKEQWDRRQIEAGRVLQERAALAFSNISDVVPDDPRLSKLPKHVSAAIKSWETTIVESYVNEEGESKEKRVPLKFTMHDKNKSLEMLEKLLELLPKEEKSAAVNVNINVAQMLKDAEFGPSNILTEADYLPTLPAPTVPAGVDPDAPLSTQEVDNASDQTSP